MSKPREVIERCLVQMDEAAQRLGLPEYPRDILEELVDRQKDFLLKRIFTERLSSYDYNDLVAFLEVAKQPKPKAKDDEKPTSKAKNTKKKTKAKTKANS